MDPQFEQRLAWLSEPGIRELLTRIGRGIEKEGLRITPEGRLSQLPHPRALGSALTHPSITTDFSESLLELITPVHTSIDSSLADLETVHSFVYRNIGDELLWSASMPCVVSGDESIPIARYGSSNVARMKEVYREGLSSRYGRAMQAIAGIHYNFSLPTDFWQATADAEGGKAEDLATPRYLGLIRNFRRWVWLLVYLFGASPAVCASFLKGRDGHHLQPFDGDPRSLHLPYATALRMGDLGYSSNAQADLTVCYNALDNYIETLSDAIRQPHADYARFASGENDHYEQLSDGLLQIENEFYSPIRPKRVAHSGEIPLGALRRGGVEYIEVRCLDINPFTPLGLDAQQIRFVDAFLLYCLLADSPDCDEDEQHRMDANLAAVVNRGREPGLTLQGVEGEVTMQQWANELLTDIDKVADRLDEAHGGSAYRQSVADACAAVEDSELTPSARTLREMREKDMPFFRLAMSYCEQWAKHLRAVPLAPEQASAMAADCANSLQQQADIEAADDISFATYLERFYAQYDQL